MNILYQTFQQVTISSIDIESPVSLTEKQLPFLTVKVDEEFCGKKTVNTLNTIAERKWHPC